MSKVWYVWNSKTEVDIIGNNVIYKYSVLVNNKNIISLL